METIDIKLPTECYKPNEAKKLYESNRNKGLKYVLNYFYKTTNPVGVMYYDVQMNDFKYYTLTDAIEAYIPNAIYFKDDKKHSLIKEFKDYKDPYNLTVEIDKPMFFEIKGQKNLNTFIGLPKLFNDIKEYDKFTDKSKEGVEFILNHLKNVWCSHNEELFEYVKNWIINLITLHKNETALYLKSIQGTGKSSITDFLLDFLGSNLSYFASSPEIVMKWNGPLKGKILLVLEEMPSSSISEWKAYNARLKSYITNPYLDTEDKYMPRSTVKNYLNLIINSNENAIKLDNSDRRYVCLDISNEMVGNTEYFDKLHGYLNNNGVKKCFYAYCLKNYNEDFNPRKIPFTETKKDLLNSNLNDIMQFIKDKYLLKKQGMDMKFSDFYEKFISSTSKKSWTKIQVSKLLDEYKIKTEIKGQKLKWIVMTFDELHELFKSKNLIHDTDEFIEDKKFDDFEDEESSKDKPIIEEQKSIIDKQTTEIEELKKQLEELKQQIPKTEIEVVQDDFDNLIVKKVEKKHKIPVNKLKKMIDYDKTQIKIL